MLNKSCRYLTYLIIFLFILFFSSQAMGFSLSINDQRFGTCHVKETKEWARTHGMGLAPQSGRLFCSGNRGMIEWTDQYGRTHKQSLEPGTRMFHRCGDPCK